MSLAGSLAGHDALPRVVRTGGVAGAVWTIVPSDGAAPVDFNLNSGEFSNLSNDDPLNNHVVIMGHNVHAGGGKVNPDHGAVHISWESHYTPVESTHYLEFHIQFTDKDDNSIRAWSAFCNEDTGQTYVFNQCHQFSVNNPADNVAFFRVTPTQIAIAPGQSLLKDTNNENVLLQLNAAGNSFVPVLKLNASDQVELGTAATGARIQGALTLGTAKITASADAPSGGSDGDVHIRTGANADILQRRGGAWVSV